MGVCGEVLVFPYNTIRKRLPPEVVFEVSKVGILCQGTVGVIILIEDAGRSGAVDRVCAVCLERNVLWRSVSWRDFSRRFEDRTLFFRALCVFAKSVNWEM